MTTTVKDFCIKYNIDWFPIYLEFVEGKKVGEPDKILSKIYHPAYGNTRSSRTDFGNLTNEQLAECQSILKYCMYSHVKHIAIDTRNIYHIDIDTPKYDKDFDLIANVAPYLKSTTESYRKHIHIKSDTFIPNLKRYQFKCEKVEWLCGQWSYAPMDGEMFNSDCPVA